MTLLDTYGHLLPNKTTVHIAVSKLLNNIRLLKGKNASIQEFRLDNGTEYLTEDMRDLGAKERFNLNPVPPYSPNLNGTSKRLNFSLKRLGA